MKKLLAILCGLMLVLPSRAGVQFATDDFAATPSISWAGGPITIAVWVRPESAAVAASLFGLQNNAASRMQCHFWSDGNLYWDYGAIGTSPGRVVASYSAHVNTWMHLTLTSDGAGGAGGQKIYLNGSLAASGNAATAGAVSGIFELGRWSDSGVNRYFTGQMKEFRIYNRALSDTEISVLANSKMKGPMFSGLIHYWPLDDQPDGTSGDGDTFKDRAGSADATGNDGANNAGLTAKAEDTLSYP